MVDPRFPFGLYAGDGLIYSSRQLRAIVGDDPRTSARARSLTESDFARTAIGTGPFVLQAWEPGVSLAFASRGLALPQRLGRPNVDMLAFRVFGDKDELIDALLAGQVQLVTQDALDAADAPVVDTLVGVRSYYAQGTTWEHLDFNLDRPIVAQPAFRKAIAHGIDRQ